MSGEAKAIAASGSGPDELDAARALNNEYLKQHPEEVARFLDGRGPAETAALLGASAPAAAARILERLNPRVAADAALALPTESTLQILTAMNPVKGAPVVVSMPVERREALLGRLDPKVASEIREVLSYPTDSAGALMDPRITAFSDDLSVDDALRKMRTFKEKDIDALYLQDASGRLTGAVTLGVLATSSPDTKLKDLIRVAPLTVVVTASREEIIDSVGAQRVSTVPVVDSEGRLVGVIRYGQLVAAAEAEATLSLQTMVGVSKEERALSSPLDAVRSRLPWLEINLATAFLAAAVVGLFQDTIAKYTALAVLLPVVAGQSGNSGMQAQAVTMRGLALREVRIGHWPRLALKEVGVGVVNGLAVGVTTMIGVFFWSHSVGLTLVIGIAMVFSMISANFWGTMVPIVLKMLGKDPATASSVILTTFTDCGGFLSFLGLATLLQSLLPTG